MSDTLSIQTLFSVSGEVIVTGANGCIGLSLVEGLLAAGADIIAVQIDDDQAVVKLAAKYGRKATLYVCDQKDPKEVAALIPRLIQDGHKPTVFVSCTGINIRGTVMDFQQEWLEDLFQVNCTSQFMLARDFAKYRTSIVPKPEKAGSAGKIIFMASGACFQGGVAVSGYAMSKSAVLGMVRSMSNELAPLGIQVNAIAPGYVDTTFTTALSSNTAFKDWTLTRIPAGRWAVPADMIGSVVFLASKASDYISGQPLIIDGGLLVR